MKKEMNVNNRARHSEQEEAFYNSNEAKKALSNQEKHLNELRPEPPDDLLDCEKKIWRDCVEKLSAGHFSKEQLPLLKSYCKSVRRYNDFEKKFDALEFDFFDEDEIKQYATFSRTLTTMLNNVTKLSAALRISLQSRTARQFKTEGPTNLDMQNRMNGDSGTKPWRIVS